MLTAIYKNSQPEKNSPTKTTLDLDQLPREDDDCRHEIRRLAQPACHVVEGW